ncbi:MAG: DUF1732 domain-containing protein [Planctomycetes bacterium]|nr:DUF1732 domain-containing protein [Planctomycetota bacterium]
MASATHSMTGVGLAAGPSELGDVRLEVRTVNGRGFACKQRLPAVAWCHETAIEERVRGAVRRGSVTVVLERVQQAPPLPDPAVLREVGQSLARLAVDLGLSPPSLADVLQCANVGRAADSQTSRPLPPRLSALLEAALADLAAHRRSDGAGTVQAICRDLDQFDALRREAAARTPVLAAEYRDRLLARVQEFVQAHLSGPIPAFDVVREVAAFADRVDVAEELQRLSAHLAEVRTTLDRGGEVGRRLEFLLQELLRETNTLGSKSPDPAIAHAVVAMKAAIERMKEQAANLE